MKEYRILKSTTLPLNTDVLWYDLNTHTLKHFYPKDNGWEGVGISNDLLKESLSKYLPLSGGELDDNATLLLQHIAHGEDDDDSYHISIDPVTGISLTDTTSETGLKVSTLITPKSVSSKLFINSDHNTLDDILLGNGSTTSLKAITTPKSGDTASRPTTGLVAGYQYFDTTLNKPIWYTGSKWVDATGAAV